MNTPSLSKLLVSMGDMVGARKALEGAREVLDSFQDGGPLRLHAPSGGGTGT
ncbi:hypothetical protein ACFYL6_20525 [Micromonospora sp. NPDC007208]|uniref:hypothetical protein n=1 Tax=Micromonospora sp. NPDC007208 TaxID=3364236 RepID=UPI0036CE8883